jgi:hypothetical protein
MLTSGLITPYLVCEILCNYFGGDKVLNGMKESKEIEEKLKGMKNF